MLLVFQYQDILYYVGVFLKYYFGAKDWLCWAALLLAFHITEAALIAYNVSIVNPLSFWHCLCLPEKCENSWWLIAELWKALVLLLESSCEGSDQVSHQIGQKNVCSIDLFWWLWFVKGIGGANARHFIVILVLKCFSCDEVCLCKFLFCPHHPTIQCMCSSSSVPTLLFWHSQF